MTGSDGNLWVIATSNSEVLKVSGAGVTLKQIPLKGEPAGIAADSANHIWIVAFNQPEFARIATDGTDGTMEKAISTPNSQSAGGIAVDNDGNIWFTDRGALEIARISAANLTVDLHVPIQNSDSYLTGLTKGSDGQLWAADNALLDEVSTSGVLVNMLSLGDGLTSITSGPDGNLWAADGLFSDNDVRVISPVNQDLVVKFTSASNAGYDGISVGPDGNLWFIESNNNIIACMTAQGSNMGTLREFPVPTPDALVSGSVQSTASGPDGNLWFIEEKAGKIGRVILSP